MISFAVIKVGNNGGIQAEDSTDLHDRTLPQVLQATQSKIRSRAAWLFRVFFTRLFLRTMLLAETPRAALVFSAPPALASLPFRSGLTFVYRLRRSRSGSRSLYLSCLLRAARSGR